MVFFSLLPYTTIFDAIRKSALWVAASRKSTLWVGGLTEKRILEGWGHGKAQSAILRSRKLRFSVTLPS